MCKPDGSPPEGITRPVRCSRPHIHCPVRPPAGDCARRHRYEVHTQQRLRPAPRTGNLCPAAARPQSATAVGCSHAGHHTWQRWAHQSSRCTAGVGGGVGSWRGRGVGRAPSTGVPRLRTACRGARHWRHLGCARLRLPASLGTPSSLVHAGTAWSTARHGLVHSPGTGTWLTATRCPTGCGPHLVLLLLPWCVLELLLLLLGLIAAGLPAGLPVLHLVLKLLPGGLHDGQLLSQVRILLLQLPTLQRLVRVSAAHPRAMHAGSPAQQKVPLSALCPGHASRSQVVSSTTCSASLRLCRTRIPESGPLDGLPPL